MQLFIVINPLYHMKQFYLILLISFLCLMYPHSTSAQVAKEWEKIKSFIPLGYKLLDLVSGDLNEDGFVDFAIVLKNQNEDNNGDALRPLLLITGSKHNKLTLRERNDSVVLCKNCGGIFGDPFQSVTIKEGVLSVKHNVGSSWRWGRTISFIYDIALEEFVLNSDIKVSYHEFKNNLPAPAANKEIENHQSFRSYSFAK